MTTCLLLFFSTQSAMDHTRDPCPWVILNDFGGAFAMGVRAPFRFNG